MLTPISDSPSPAYRLGEAGEGVELEDALLRVADDVAVAHVVDHLVPDGGERGPLLGAEVQELAHELAGVVVLPAPVGHPRLADWDLVAVERRARGGEKDKKQRGGEKNKMGGGEMEGRGVRDSAPRKTRGGDKHKSTHNIEPRCRIFMVELGLHNLGLENPTTEKGKSHRHHRPQPTPQTSPE